jgi:plasmid maintenance system antidote protein VapI
MMASVWCRSVPLAPSHSLKSQNLAPGKNILSYVINNQLLRCSARALIVMASGMSHWNDPTALRRTLGLNIRVRRAELNLSQHALAHAVGTSASHLSAVEKGRRNITVDQIQKIALALGLEPIDLVRLRPMMGLAPARNEEPAAVAAKIK